MGLRIYFQQTIYNQRQEQRGAEVFQIPILTATPVPLAPTFIENPPLCIRK